MQIAINWWVDKQILVYLYNVLLFDKNNDGVPMLTTTWNDFEIDKSYILHFLMSMIYH